jgi:hypothetical protein
VAALGQSVNRRTSGRIGLPLRPAPKTRFSHTFRGQKPKNKEKSLRREKKLTTRKRKSSRLAPAKRELETQAGSAFEGSFPFATPYAPGRAPNTFVALGKKPFGVLI